MPIHQLLDPNPDTPDPCPLHAEPLIELQRLRVDLDGDIRRYRKGGRASQFGEVGEPHRDGDRAAHHLLLPHPASRAVSHPEQLTADGVRVVGIAPEGLLRADAVFGLLWGDPGAISPPRELAEHAAGVRPEDRTQAASRSLGEVADGVDAKSMQLLCSRVTY